MPRPHGISVLPRFRPKFRVVAWMLVGVVTQVSLLAAQEGAQPIDVDISTAAGAPSSYCCPDHWLTVDAQYLFFWSRGAYLPALVTSSDAGVAFRDAGVLGEPTTTVLFGDQLTSSGPRSGVRLRAAAAIGDARQWWLEAEGLALPTYSDRFAATSLGDPILGRPFYDEAIGLPNAELVAYPGAVAGEISVDASTNVWGTGIALNRNLLCCDLDGAQSGYRLNMLVGYRYLELSDDVRIDERLVSTSEVGPILIGTQLDVTDDFQSRSRFHGVDLGLRGEWVRSRYFVSGEMRVALGQTDHELSVLGSTRVSVPGVGSLEFPGGVLASGEVLGTHADREFAVVPQAELRVGRQFTDHLRISIGYSFLYWSQVVRAGEQIPTSIDSSELPRATATPGSNHMMPLFSSSFWAQGITANLEWRY